MQIEPILALTAAVITIGAAWVLSFPSETTKRDDEFPNLPGFPIIGNLLDILGPNLKIKVHETKGPAFLRIPGLPRTLVFDDLALLRQVLGRSLPSFSIVGDPLLGLPHGIFSAVGIEHKRLRNLGVRGLSKSVLLAQFEHIKSHAEEQLVKMATENKPIIPTLFLQMYAYKTICVIMAGSDSEQLKRLESLFEPITIAGRGGQARLLPKWLDFAGSIEKGTMATDLVIKTCIEIAIERRAAMEAGKEFSDGLSALIDARDSDGSFLSDFEIASFFFTMISAGLDTTGQQSSTMFYFLANSISQQDLAALRSEVNQSFAMESEATISALPLLDAFVKESMRIFPMIPQGNRVLTDDIVLDGKKVPAGTHIGPLRDRGFLVDNPDEFRLDRFVGDDALDKKRTIEFIPFGMGERMCIGIHLARLEMKVLIATALRSYEIVKGPGSPTFAYYPFKTVKSYVTVKPLKL
ncbi:hypothetical protein HK100_012590 [Physocladia obscura]|uniref:Cytochrome P450 n=1 Tax=Physocladia obscura TaxID=109957 RepID=A0AAD5T2C6_9FUNG|nr:hypothetical protein HK100_012590 [Physocladia obscura]